MSNVSQEPSKTGDSSPLVSASLYIVGMLAADGLITIDLNNPQHADKLFQSVKVVVSGLDEYRFWRPGENWHGRENSPI